MLCCKKATLQVNMHHNNIVHSDILILLIIIIAIAWPLPHNLYLTIHKPGYINTYKYYLILTQTLSKYQGQLISDIYGYPWNITINSSFTIAIFIFTLYLWPL